jgi:hypothetical protein
MSTLGEAADVRPVIKFLPHTVYTWHRGNVCTCSLGHVIYCCFLAFCYSTHELFPRTIKLFVKASRENLADIKMFFLGKPPHTIRNLGFPRNNLVNAGLFKSIQRLTFPIPHSVNCFISSFMVIIHIWVIATQYVGHFRSSAHCMFSL